MQYIIATHGSLAEGYVNTIQVLTQATNVHAICAYVKGEQFPENLIELLAVYPEEEPVMIFTDLVGGSVSQKIMEVIKRKNTHIIAGVNLPLILEFIMGNVGTSKEEIEGVIQEAKMQLVYVNPLIEDVKI